MRSFLRILGTALMVFGAAILVGMGGFSLYDGYQGQQYVRNVEQQLAQSGPITPVPTIQLAAADTPTPIATIAPTATTEPATSTAVSVPTTSGALPTAEATPTVYIPRLSGTPDSGPLLVTHLDPTPIPTSTPTAAPSATPVPIYPAIRIVAPSIKLDSPVVESPIVDGQWQVPKFVAGHLEGTAEPLQPGNVVLSGHVESISSGNVFANIGNLRPGATVQLYTRQRSITYTVTKLTVVDHHDVSVVNPTPDQTLTLITCTGTWLPLERDYNQRLVVVAKASEPGAAH